MKKWILLLIACLTVVATWAESVSLAEAVEATNLLWTTSGNENWFVTMSNTFDGVDAAQSGLITHRQTSWMETSVYGAGTIGFWWKVDSEIDYDWLRFKVDGVETFEISGDEDWQFVSLELPDTGTHVLRWEYSKDKSDAAGADCGWVDEVAWTPVPEGFELWMVEQGVSGSASEQFAGDHNSNGVANVFEYAYGTNHLVLVVQVVDGRPVVETLQQDEATLPYATVRVVGSTNLLDWAMPISPSEDAAPEGRAWFEADVSTNSAFFKLEAELR